MRKTPSINSSLSDRAVADDIMRLFDGDPLPDSAQADVAGVLSLASGKSTDSLRNFNAGATDSSENTGSASTPLNVDTASTVTVADGASVEINGASAQSATFTGTTGTLKIDHSVAFTAPVSGLAGADALDLADISYGAKTTATFSGNTIGGTLTVTDGTHTAKILLQGNYLTSSWTLSGDGHGGTVVVDPPLNDGTTNAPVGPAQLPTLLNSYAVRPPWKVAGVDYAVGYSTGTALKDWQTINLPGVSVSKEGGASVVTITGNNITLNGYDFSLHGGAQVLVQGSNDTVSNSKFVYTSAMVGYYSLIGVTPSASNFTLKYCVLDGNGPALGQAAANQTALIGDDGSGTTTLQYNWFLNFNQHAVEMSGTGSLDYQFNLIENGGSGASGQHLNFLQFSSPGSYNPVIVQFNTTYQPTSNPSGGEGFQMYNNGTGNITGTLAYNTMIASPDGSGLPHISAYPSGGGGVTTASVHDNYISKGGSPTFFYDPPDTYSGDINLVTGAAIDGPSGSAPPPAVPPTSVAPPVIKLFSPDTGVVGDSITNASTLTLTGTAVANSTVKVFDGSAQIGTTTADSSGSWSYITSVLTDAMHVLTATDTVSGVTSAASSPLSVTVDTHVPAAPVLVSDSVVNTNHVLLSGTAEANSTVKVFDGATLVGTTTAGANGNWSVTTGALTDGTHSLVATAADAAGSVSAQSQPLAPVIGSPAPGAPTIASFSPDTGVIGDGITDANTLTLTGTAVANSTVTVFDGTAKIGTATVNSSGAWTFTTAALADGSHKFTATDTSSGATSAASSALTVTVDTVAPNAPVETDASIVSGTTKVQLTGTAEANSTLQVFDGTTQVGTTTANSSGAWSLTTGTLASGGHSFTTKATDAAGNTSLASAALAVTIPSAPTAPAAPTIASFSPNTGVVGDGITDANMLTLTGTAVANSTVKVFDGSTQIGTTTADSSGSWSYITSVLTDAIHVLTATDTVSGVTSAASSPLSVTVDTHVPAAPVLVSDTVVNTNHVLLSGTAEANSTIKVFDGTAVVATTTAGANGAWNVTTGALAIGTHNLTATATDVAGTTSAASQPLDPVIGPAPPAAPQITSFSPDSGIAGDHITNQDKLTLAGTAVANSTVKVFDGTMQVGTATADSTGAWTLTTTKLAGGSHSLTATGTVSGVTSVASSPFSVTVDTVAPAAPVLVSDSVVDTNHVLLTGTAEANSTITVYDGTTTVGTTTTGANGTWSVTTPALASGTHALTATATDVAGKTSAMSDALDPVIPGPPTGPTVPTIVSFSPETGSAGDHITNDNAVTLTGTAVAGSTVDVFDGTDQIGSTTADGKGQWSLTTPELSDGSHSLTATDTDASGHTSAASRAFSITTDTHQPDAPTMTAYSQGGVAVGSATTLHDLVLEGTAEAHSKIEIFDGEKSIGTATTNDSGTWSFEAGHLAVGDHIFTATATDAAGTTSPASEAEITVTQPESTVGFTSVSENSSHVATIKGTADANSQVKLYEGNTSLGTVNAADDGTWSFTTGHLSNKVHMFTAQEVDSTGQVVAKNSGAAILGESHSTLTSTSGNDLLVGNGHSDTFVFAANFGHDVIQDFVASGKGHDAIQFSKTVFDSFASVLSHASQAGQDVVISTGSDTLTLKNTKLGALNSHDFHFA
jgi:hypothetical protein